MKGVLIGIFFEGEGSPTEFVPSTVFIDMNAAKKHYEPKGFVFEDADLIEDVRIEGTFMSLRAKDVTLPEQDSVLCTYTLKEFITAVLKLEGKPVPEGDLVIDLIDYSGSFRDVSWTFRDNADDFTLLIDQKWSGGYTAFTDEHILVIYRDGVADVMSMEECTMKFGSDEQRAELLKEYI